MFVYMNIKLFGRYYCLNPDVSPKLHKRVANGCMKLLLLDSFRVISDFDLISFSLVQ